LDSSTPSAPAIAAIGLPAFGLSVFRPSRSQSATARTGEPPPAPLTAASSSAVIRAGMKFAASSRRAAALPSHSVGPR
jgi:hypothetical protein